MSEEDNLFQAEHVYTQIEQLGNAQSQYMPRSSDARLISNLRQVHAEDREIVGHVWAKLNEQARANEQNRQSQFQQNRPENMLKGPQPMQNISNAKRPKKTIIRLLELSAAILVIGALVGGMFVLVQKNRQQLGSVGAPTPTSVATSPAQATHAPVTPTPLATPTATQTQAACNVPHPATMTALSGSSDAALFYVTGGGGYQSVPTGTALIRYDLVTGKQTTLIQPSTDSAIIDASLSPDKQWLFLRVSIGDSLTTKLQVMRTDGNMLQTVYESCTGGSTAFGSSSWSPNGQEVAFPSSGISVLDLLTGKLQSFLPGTGSVIYQPVSWINNQQLLVKENDGANTTGSAIYLLDISKGVNQQASSLTSITSIPTFCGNLALSANGTQLFRSSCTLFNKDNCQGGQVQGPSTVYAMPAAGGSARTVYSSQSEAVTDIYPASASSLLIYIENTTGDLSQNGLWKINTDGSGLTHLTTTSVLACQYNPYAYPQTQISSDGQNYGLLSMDGGQQKLVAGSLAGGSPTTILEQQFGNSNVLILAGIGVV